MTKSARPRVILLLGGDAGSNAVYHAMARVANVVVAIEEEPPPRAKMVRRRVKRLGFIRVLDQLLFIALAVPILRSAGAGRMCAIREQFGMDVRPIPREIVRHVPSVNDDAVIEALRAHQPDVVVVNGTRIIAKRVLNCVDAPFVNTHAGITPAYRGVHGGYWALAEGKPELAGVTVHHLDTGIDTGAVIAQDVIHPGPEDSFCTYPTLQLAAGLPLLEKAVLELHQGTARATEPMSKTSRLYYHPGLTTYLFHRLRDGIR